MINDYNIFLQNKQNYDEMSGFEPSFIHDKCFDFQKYIIEWACLKGRAAIFADCGLGKTLMQLVWAHNVVKHTNKKVLILTPIAVSHQTVNESIKFGIDAKRSNKGELESNIVVTNYERLHYFNPLDFIGIVCDESSILKNFSGSTRKNITKFMEKIKYRLLCTATAAPNDYMELGTSSEALSYLKYKEMLSMFFSHNGGDTSKWSLKQYANDGAFWRWMCSWARAIRNPSDIGFPQSGFNLPELIVKQHVVKTQIPPDGFLFTMPAVGLTEQREERKRTINERCERASNLINQHNNSAIAWCHLNIEGDTLTKMIPDAEQVSGSDSDERKESIFRDFESGNIRVIVTKPTIAGFGLNWQHCNHQTFFPSHSFEQWYQSIRRCWRFGQKNNVIVDVISSEGEADVVVNLDRKTRQAGLMFEKIVKHMNDVIIKNKQTQTYKKIEVPTWI